MKAQMSYLFAIVAISSLLLLWAVANKEISRPASFISEEMSHIFKSENLLISNESNEIGKWEYLVETNEYFPDPIWIGISNDKRRVMPSEIPYYLIAQRIYEKSGNDRCVAVKKYEIIAGNETVTAGNASELIKKSYKIPADYHSLVRLVNDNIIGLFDTMPSLCNPGQQICNKLQFYNWVMKYVTDAYDNMTSLGSIDCYMEPVKLKYIKYVEECEEDKYYCKPQYSWGTLNLSGVCGASDSAPETPKIVPFVHAVRKNKCQMIHPVDLGFEVSIVCQDSLRPVYDKSEKKFKPMTVKAIIQQEVITSGICIESHLKDINVIGSHCDSQQRAICDCEYVYDYCKNTEHPDGECKLERKCYKSPEFNIGCYNKDFGCYAADCDNIPKDPSCQQTPINHNLPVGP